MIAERFTIRTYYEYEDRQLSGDAVEVELYEGFTLVLAGDHKHTDIYSRMEAYLRAVEERTGVPPLIMCVDANRMKERV